MCITKLAKKMMTAESTIGSQSAASVTMGFSLGLGSSEIRLETSNEGYAADKDGVKRSLFQTRFGEGNPVVLANKPYRTCPVVTHARNLADFAAVIKLDSLWPLPAPKSQLPLARACSF